LFHSPWSAILQREDWVAGADGCKDGWIAVFYRRGTRADAQVAIFRNFEALVQECPASTIAIDMPIGLPAIGQSGGRTAEHEVRARIGRRRSSVFGIPARAAVMACCEPYQKVCEIARRHSADGTAPSIQAYHIFKKIMTIDTALRADPALVRRIFEVHPELSFSLMKGAPLTHSKKRNGSAFGLGMDERRDLLLARGFAAAFLDLKPPRGAGRDDFYDACAASWSAARIAGGQALDLPLEPEYDEFGLPMRICG
jgi:predicted RNase H-like nuclease